MSEFSDLKDVPWDGIEASGRLLRPAEVAKRTGLSRSQIYQMIAEERFPPFLKLSKRVSAMPEVWLNAFIAKCASTPVAGSAAGLRTEGGK